MAFYREAFEEQYNEDGLLVMAQGLGLQRVIAKFLEYYSSVKAGKKLVFCINALGDEEAFRNILLAEGVSPSNLPKVLTNDTLTSERADLYVEGGCFIVTSRILIIDLLKQQVDPKRISGILVCNAHKVTATTIETFILRVFKEGNWDGFVKGFSDDPDSLTSSFAKVERLLKDLYCKKLYLWPRFHARVSQQLNAAPPEVIELTQPLTHHMTAIQAGLLVAMRITIDELKKATPHLHTEHLNLENGLSRNFDTAIKAQLDPDWHNLSMRTKDLVQDLTTLRRTLEYLLGYDAVTFYLYLRSLQSAQQMQGHGKVSLWLSTPAADTIFERSKWRVLQVLSPEDAAKAQNKSNGRGRVRVAQPSEMADTVKTVLRLRSSLRGNLEVPPKWTLLMDVMKEIRTDFIASKQDKRAPDGFEERVIILVKEARTAMEVTECLASGPRTVLLSRYKFYVSKVCGDIRDRLAKKRGSTRGTSRGDNQVGGGGPGKNTWSRGFLSSNNKTTTTTTTTSSSSSSSSVPDTVNLSTSGDRDLDVSTDALSSAASAESILRQSNLTLEEVKKLGVEEQLLVCEEIALRENNAVSGKKRDASSSASGGGPRKVAATGGYFRQSNVARDAMAATQGNLSDSGIATDIDAIATTAELAEALERPMGTTGIDTELEPLDDLHVLVITIAELNQNSDVLPDFSPSRVVLFDPDVATVRALEVYQANLCNESIPVSPAAAAADDDDDDSKADAGKCMKIYFLMYKSSTDEHRYVGALERERRSFQRLIDDKATMVISLRDRPADISRETAADQTLTMSDTRSSSSSKQQQARRVIVDLREFRSSLPSLLHSSLLEIVPETLIVGDYILAPDICVERKGIADLFQSFGSGRLFNQAEQMLKHYKFAALLIEFHQDKSFSLQNRGELSSEIQLSSICSKMALLMLSFPKLKILWSRSPNATADIFKSLKVNHKDPDVQKAVDCGANTGYDGDSRDSAGNTTKEARARDDAMNILMSLPGINNVNYRQVVNHVDDVAALSRMSVSELVPIIGPANAKKLATFFSQKPIR